MGGTRIERCTVTTPAGDRTSREVKKSQKARPSAVQKAATKRTRQTRKVPKKPAGGTEIRLAVTEAAERLFRDRSPADVTLREIAAEAGVNYSLVYRYFRTKEALIGAVFSPRVKGIREQYVDAPEGPEALRDVHYMHDAPGYARSLAWVILEGNDLDVLFQELETNEDHPDEAEVAALEPRDLEARIAIGSFLALAMGWDLYEPYLLRLTGLKHVDKPVLNEYLARLADELLTSTSRTRKRARK
jgi:AcrR family transcriptional regulator